VLLPGPRHVLGICEGHNLRTEGSSGQIMETETKPLWVTTREAMGKTWTVALYPNNGALEDPTFTCDHGRFWASEQCINVNAKLLPEGRDQALLHELLHLADLFSRTKIQEEEVSRLSQALYAFLRGFGLWNEFPWPDRENEIGRAHV